MNSGTQHQSSAPRDLAGKKVGATFVTMVDVPPGQIPQELARGTIDAVATWQPNVFDAQVALGENAVSFTEIDAYRSTILLVEDSPDDATLTLRAFKRSNILNPIGIYWLMTNQPLPEQTTK